jgi:hypothetical protein
LLQLCFLCVYLFLHFRNTLVPFLNQGLLLRQLLFLLLDGDLRLGRRIRWNLSLLDRLRLRQGLLSLNDRCSLHFCLDYLGRWQYRFIRDRIDRCLLNDWLVWRFYFFGLCRLNNSLLLVWLKLVVVAAVRGICKNINNIDRVAFELTILHYLLSLFDDLFARLETRDKLIILRRVVITNRF